MLFAAEPSETVQIITLVVGCLTPLGLAILGYLTLKINAKANAAKVEVAAVKSVAVEAVAVATDAKAAVEDAAVLQIERGEKRDKKIGEVNKVLTDVHLLTNSGMKEVKDQLNAAREEIRGLQQNAIHKAEIIAAGLASKIDRTDAHVIANGGGKAHDIADLKQDVAEVPKKTAVEVGKLPK